MLAFNSWMHGRMFVLPHYDGLPICLKMQNTPDLTTSIQTAQKPVNQTDVFFSNLR